MKHMYIREYNQAKRTQDAALCLLLKQHFLAIKPNDHLIITKLIGNRKPKHITFRAKVSTRNENVLFCKTSQGYESVNFADVVTGNIKIQKYNP